MSSYPSQFLNVDGKLLFVTFGMHSGASLQKQYSASFIPDIISFAMQPLHNAYTEEYQWFYYMLNAIPTMRLWWVQGGKSTAAQKVMAHVIMASLIPHRKYFHCEIRMYVVCFGPLRPILLHDRAQATISIIFTVKLCWPWWWFDGLLFSWIRRSVSYTPNMSVYLGVSVILSFGRPNQDWARTKVPWQQDRYQTGDFIMSHGTRTWNVMELQCICWGPAIRTNETCFFSLTILINSPCMAAGSLKVQDYKFWINSQRKHIQLIPVFYV